MELFHQQDTTVLERILLYCVLSHRMLNMSVTDSLVGRVIGLGGNKINSITVSVLKFNVYLLCVSVFYGHTLQRESGAQITVSSRQPRPSENRIITIRVCTYTCVCMCLCLYVSMCVSVCLSVLLLFICTQCDG